MANWMEVTAMVDDENEQYEWHALVNLDQVVTIQPGHKPQTVFLIFPDGHDQLIRADYALMKIAAIEPAALRQPQQGAGGE